MIPNPIFVVRVVLNNPQKPHEAMGFMWLFDQQPTEDDVMHAFVHDPLASKHEDYPIFGGVLDRCLNTFGVPKLNGMHMRMTDAPSGEPVQVPLLKADWTMNVLNSECMIANVNVGSIIVSTRSVIELKPAAPAPEQAKTPAVKPKKVKGREIK